MPQDAPGNLEASGTGHKWPLAKVMPQLPSLMTWPWGLTLWTETTESHKLSSHAHGHTCRTVWGYTDIHTYTELINMKLIKYIYIQTPEICGFFFFFEGKSLSETGTRLGGTALKSHTRAADTGVSLIQDQPGLRSKTPLPRQILWGKKS